MAGKYTPLENYLRDLPPSQKEVTLSFDQIEGILKFRFGDSCHLPPDGGLMPPRAVPSSAYEDERWWMREKEGNHVNLRAWASAGWKIESVEVDKNQARLVRV